ncbi:hypothetical protein C3L33_18892, partial [Rhododendron williamsianum]
MWSHVVFEHPATFDTLAMEETKKKQIMNDLITFTKSKDYYKKNWKGLENSSNPKQLPPLPPLLTIWEITGNIALKEDAKHTIISLKGEHKAAKRDHLSAKKARRLKKEQTEASNKMRNIAAKIVTAEKTKTKLADAIANAKARLKIVVSLVQDVEILIFTTNYVEKLDPAMIRRGRMDKHIELSYCCFEAFKVLAMNYLDLESHHLYDTIGKLLEETKMSLTDVAENLMPKFGDEDANACLANLIKAIKKAKEEVKVKVKVEEEKEEEEERVKAEEEKKVKAEKEEKEKA